MSDLDVSGLLGTVIVAGVATKMVTTMFPSQQQQQSPTRRKKKKANEENGYVRNRQVFGSSKYSPF